jgi:formate/nitrite transporter FocA (FNT family)
MEDSLLNEKGEPVQDDGLATPDLTDEEKREAKERTSVSAPVVHEAIRRDGEEELRRPASALAWSGLAAGLSMGFSFVGEGLLHHYLPDSSWRPLVVSLGYPFGFLLIIIGRQQLFTENTLTAIIPLLARRNLGTLISVLRLWLIVLCSNLVGAHLFAWVIANTPMYPPEFQPSFRTLAAHAAAVSFGTAVLRGIFAGWLIAMVVWMLAAVDTGRIAIIIILTYMVGLSGLTHIIAGSVEVLYLVMSGAISWFSFAGGYMIPTLIGNIIGGVALVSALNHAQVVAGRPRNRIGSKENRDERRVSLG